jgi:obg-like ATPase 1
MILCLLKVDPLDDVDVINLELALSDLGQIEKRLERLGKGRPIRETAHQT